ncbi:MAG: endonuclease/exonuclease/phosphatase family protein [Elusimicrobiota bacterium]
MSNDQVTGTEIKIMTYNIHHGADAENKFTLDKIAEFIKSENPDLVGIQEVLNMVDSKDCTDQVAYLKKYTGLHPVFNPNVIKDKYTYGVMCLSKYPVKKYEHRLLPSIEYLNNFSEQRGCIISTVEIGKTTVTFIVTHLGLTQEEQLLQAKELMKISAGIEGYKIMVGDFNEEVYKTVKHKVIGSTQTVNIQEYSPVMEELLGEKPQRLRKDRYADAFMGTKPGETSTFPADKSDIRIDYVLISPELYKGITEKRVVPSLLSDHLPLIVKIRIP